MEGSQNSDFCRPEPPYDGSGSSSTVTEIDRHGRFAITELDRHDSIKPDLFYWRSNFWNEAFADPAPAHSRPRCPVQSHDAVQNPEQHTQMTREANVGKRFELPETPDSRQESMRQYEIMQQRCLDHSCEQVPCFDEACTFGLPQDSGCRYSEAFHKKLVNPCMWGWGKILVEHAVRYGLVAAMMTDLKSMAKSYRERHGDDQRFTGPALVRDPPDAPDGTAYYVVVRPSEQK